MLAFKSILLLAFTWALAATALPVSDGGNPKQPIILLPGQVVLRDLSKLDQAVMRLTFKINDKEGSFKKVKPIVDAFRAVDKANRRAIEDVQTVSETIDIDSSQKIASLLTKDVAVDVRRAVKAVMKKKTKFEAVEARDLVLNALKRMKNDHDNFSAKLMEKMDNSTLVDGNAAVASISKALDEGIERFSRRSSEVHPMEDDGAESDSE
ncbi:hypothetical protein GLAREA_09591 [Glarea lozoyensis ATCC 20868]|uniref:Uncharacterized protein n=1 Tax=Glarea lozoyensis (strain ATCC 20868 / MF5171) TaxID=1116229 RepID=S3CS17_GLAL2|nr:uncharacterized protein GLAREA_09591 [Glarea lozoyensis ATCC 20868]EPE28470.1 hypothetical protein GLAREA_09591 [Glarea lozoyensis ATCC 20868]